MFSQYRNQQQLDSLGRFTQIALVILATVFLIATGFHKDTTHFQALAEFFQGNFERMDMYPLLTIQTVVLFTITLLFAITVFCKLFINLNQVSQDRTEDIHDNFNNGPIPFYISILLENILARWLFIDVLGNWLHADPAGILILWFTGNLIWSAVHLFLYQKGKRNPKYILPVFLAGIFLGYFYIKYGFLITVLVHLSYDIFVNAQFKKQQLNQKSLSVGFYWILVLILAILIAIGQHADFSFITNLLSDEVTTPTPVIMFTTILIWSALTDIVSSLLAMDNLPISKHFTSASVAKMIVILIVNIFIVAGMAYLFGLVANIFFTSMFVKTLMVTALIFVQISPKTGSAMAKSWVFTTLGCFLIAFTVLSFPYLTAVLILVAAALFDLPAIVLSRNYTQAE